MSRRVLARWPLSRVDTFEDAFLRSVLPGLGSPPIGLNIDDIGVHFDGRAPSRFEEILQTTDFDAALLARADRGRAFLRHYGLSKYNAVPRGVGPEAGYILVIDQVAGDASISGGLADAGSFTEMLAAARVENPGARIVIRTHPAVQNGDKCGHFSEADEDENTVLSSAPMNPWDLLEGASKVYCVSSQMGFEAILAGHRPEVFGVPFYAGWGLSEDRQAVPRRTRKLTIDELFAGAMLVYPFWYDHARRCACEFEEAAQQLLAQARHHWDCERPVNALGMRLWKRWNVARFLRGVVFVKTDDEAVHKAQETSGQVVVWASGESAGLVDMCDTAGVPLQRMEDGFLRSSGLGAELTPAASLVLDDRGIYYDPSKPSQLEHLISKSSDLPACTIDRAAALRVQILAAGVSKYNLKGPEALNFPTDRKVILVPGQVEDDASIKLGAGDVQTNLGLLQVARAAHPLAYIVYKPHPDVLAGLRDGSVGLQAALEFCDRIIEAADVPKLIEASNEVWTMTSLLGFEALLRGKAVTCLGTPFYAGWGLTQDLGPICERRGVQVTLDQLVHATLIDYPRYHDPVSNLPCTPELIVDRLASGQTRKPAKLRVLAKLQGIFAGYASIWR
jgi:capsular polysaccharide export protein